MNDSTRRLVLLAVGLLLVTSPLYAPALDLTGRDYEYRTTPVVAEDDRIRIANGSEIGLFHGVEGIDCLYEFRPSRECIHDAGLLNGTRTADHPGILRVTGNPPLGTDARYVAFTNDAPVYVRTVDWRDGEYVLGLERVSASEALDDVAVDSEYVPEAVTTAVESGSVRTNEPLSFANRIVKTDDGYYLVYRVSESQSWNADAETERRLEWVAVLLGAALLWRN